MDALRDEEIAFLEPYLPTAGTRNASGKNRERFPFVTLTYAQSMDSMIAIAPGARTTLSGAATKTMTHYLRKKHDAIMVGATTAIVDDPSLNCRYPNAGFADQPQPVILDAKGRWNALGSKVVRLADEGQGKKPWVVTTAAHVHEETAGRAGIKLVSIKPALEPTCLHPLAWSAILSQLKDEGIDSVMVEGGASVINALLALPHLVDSVIVTIAPTWLGRGGVAVAASPKTNEEGPVNAATLDETIWHQFGQDVVLCGRFPYHASV